MIVSALRTEVQSVVTGDNGETVTLQVTNHKDNTW